MRREDLTPEILKRMGPEDQKVYGPGWFTPPQHKLVQKPKRPINEIKEQREFATWCCRKRSEGLLEWDYNRSDKRPTGLVGRSDFVLWLKPALTLFIEFKSPEGKLSQAQEIFKAFVERLGFKYYIVYTCEQAKATVQQYL